MLKVERKADSRAQKAIIHRLADIPGGVTVSVANLGGNALYEGTPLCLGSSGMYDVVKTGKVTTAYSSGTSLEIAKGSHFKVGDKIADENASMYAEIAAIDKTSNADKDVVTLVSGFDAGLAENAKLITVTVSSENHGAVAQGAHETTTATEIKVDKGNTLAVGDYIAGTGADPMTGKEITNIDRGNDGYDLVTVGAQIGKAIADDEDLVVVTASSGTTAKDFDVLAKQGDALAIAGSNMDVVSNENLFVDAWLMAVVKDEVAPVVTDAIKAQLSGVKFV
jgi:hypothetical protein